ncbi:CcdB family protein [Jannaschia marina]|uniref:CcdB family protein n=1 Tax=Jannaschia marina TaxID=2741674 RepID=UPI0015CCCE76|nr:CcdB family protein [Jannaschia marina]
MTDRPRQWHIHRNLVSGGLILVIQSDLLDEIGSRLVVPVYKRSIAPNAAKLLSPVVMRGDEVFVAFPLHAAAIRTSEIGPFVASAEDARDDVTRALDLILSGV